MDTSVFFNYPTVEPAPDSPTGGLLPGLSETDMDALLAYTQTRRLRVGETLANEGEQDRALYLITDGRLQVTSQAHGALAAYTAPAVVGELAFVDGGPRSATLLAVTDGEALRLGFDAFESLSARDPQLGRRVLLGLARLLALRLRAARGGSE